MNDGVWVMLDPEGVIMDELASGKVSQESVALTYSFILRQPEDYKKADWPKINSAIKKRWKSDTALDRIKKRAWKFAQ